MRVLHTTPTPIAEVTGSIRQRVNGLLASNGSLEDRAAALDRIGQLLESLPLSSSDFGLANARLGNARRYYESGETGAAHYELRLLLGGMNTMME